MHHKSTCHHYLKKALDILGDLYADADPFLFGRIILLIKNALKAGL